MNERLGSIDRRLFGDAGRSPAQIRGEVLLVSDQRDFRVLVDPDDSEGLRFQRTTWDWPTLIHASRQAKVIVIDARDADRVEEVGRLANSAAAIVIFGVSNAPLDAMRYLDAGAADYLSPSTSPAERGARLRVALRYVMSALPEPQQQVFTFGDVVVSLDRWTVEKAQRPVRLTAMEFRLMAALLERGGDIVTHHELLATMRGVEHLSDRGYLRIYIRQLREKLEDDPQLPLYIRTEWGMGYRLLAEKVDVQERRAGNASAG